MSQSVGRDSIPWPGPRPYREEEADVFFGRDPEIRDLLNKRIATGRLTVLTGESAAGKSSLLAAGLAPRLWEAWGSLSAANDGARPPLPLILRDWGGIRADDFDSLFQNVLLASLSAAQEYLSAHGADPSAIDRVFRAKVRIRRSTPHAFDIVTTLCEQVGPVLLLLDQFEEVLRLPGNAVANQAIRVIADLYRFEHRVQILVSLRREAIDKLAPLESVVGGLADRKYYVSTLTAQRAGDAVVSAAKASQRPQVSFDDGVVAKIKEWASGHSQAIEEPTGAPGPRLAPQINLLVFQCILRESYESARKDSPTSSRLVITREDLPQFPARATKVERHRLVLSRWISRVLRLPYNPPDSSSESDSKNSSREPFDILAEPVVDSLVRRCARLIAPHLTAGEYKVSLTEQELYRKAHGEDLGRLGIGGPSKGRMTSGPARELSAVRTQKLLRQVFDETLGRLQQGNILKRYRVGGFCELTQDQIAKPFTDWSEVARKENWDEMVASLIASPGADITVASPTSRPSREVVAGVSWPGAWVSPGERKEGRLVDTIFRECDLKGVVFSRCTFVGVRFEGGELDGVMFKDCRFERGVHGPTVFRGVHPHGLTFVGSRLGDVRFEQCDLRQILLQRTTLTGSVVFDGSKGDCSISSGIFEQLKRAKGDGFVLGPRSVMSYCSWDRASQAALFTKFKPKPEQLLSCGELVPVRSKG